MNENLRTFLLAQNIGVTKKNSLDLTIVRNAEEGVGLVKKLIYFLVDSKTVLFLSGGKTPENVYSEIALEQKINPGAVAMVDERFGERMHKNSNEKMIRGTGLLSYLEEKKIPFYPILRLHPKGALDLARDYNKKVKNLLENFSKRIAIMGVGEDGHTAGLPASPKLPPRLSEAGQRGEPCGIKNSKSRIQNYVTEIDNFPGEFRKRITLTFKALSQMDLLIVLAFGSAKKNALDLMFEEGSLREIPARFYTGAEIAVKTLLITDQKI